MAATLGNGPRRFVVSGQISGAVICAVAPRKVGQRATFFTPFDAASHARSNAVKRARGRRHLAELLRLLDYFLPPDSPCFLVSARGGGRRRIFERERGEFI